MKFRGGYTMVTLLVFLSILVIGLMAAVPVWQTQIQRESEEELIFRGKQYVEAIRRYEQKNPGTFPKDIEDLVKARCLRRHFRDPMTQDGKWYLITQAQTAGPSPRQGRSGLSAPRPSGGSASFSFASRPGAAGQVGGGGPVTLVLVPEEVISGVQNMRILGVASKSERESIRVYNDATKYSEWLFYFGQDPNAKPEVTIYGRDEKK
jgi:type II secretory pathway pseudopilin PulG